MPNSVRVLAVVIFIGLMFFVRQFVHFVVDLGFIPWLFLMGGIFWLAIRIENRGRKRDGRPLYSWAEAKELVAPLAILGAIIVVAYSLR